ncbi:MAG: dihydroneopterin aldolase, partial [Paracoccus sp. (in: a-proteobacteria)]|nr:dihydroneopterin aldolase [Paracoccus sp. (in: a-proteobacteria)]
RDQRLRFNLTVDLRQSVSNADDHVDAVLSYDVLTQAVQTALSDQRYNLVETLAERIAAEVLAHPRAARIEVTVEKLDRGPGALGVTIRRDAARVGATGVAGLVRVVLWQRPPCNDRAPDAASVHPSMNGAVVVVPEAPGLPLPPGGDRRRILLLALDQAAWSLAGELGLEVAATRTEIDAAIHAARPVIWAPARLASDAPAAGQTGEELAQWLATRLKAERFDRIPPCPAGHPAELACPLSD